MNAISAVPVAGTDTARPPSSDDALRQSPLLPSGT